MVNQNTNEIKKLKRKSIKRNTLTIILLTTLTLFSLFFGKFWIPDPIAMDIIRYATKPLFYLILALIGWNLYGILRSLEFRKLNWSHIALPFILALLGTLFLISHNQYGFKILSDEYVISSQAKSLHFKNTSDYPSRTFSIYGEVKAQNTLVDKRPPTFSIILSLFHDITGYRVSNVFILNSLIAFFILVTILLVGIHCSKGKKAGHLNLLNLLLISISLPLFSKNATGGGLELLNVFLIIITTILAYKSLLTKDPKWLNLWIFTTILLIHTRHESILFLVSFAIVFLIKIIREKTISQAIVLALLPLYLLIYLLRQRVFEIYPEISLQLNSNRVAFSLDYFYENIGHAISYFYEFDLQSSSSYLLSSLGLICLILIFVKLAKKLITPTQSIANSDIVLIAYGAIIITNFFILMCYHWGRVDELEVSRLTLPLFLLFGASICRVILTAIDKWKTLPTALFTTAAAYLFFVAIPNQTSDLFIRENYHARIDNWAVKIIHSQADLCPFVITTGSLIWDLHQIAAYHPRDISKQLQKFNFHLKNRSFTPYILEKLKMDPTTGLITSDGTGLFEQQYKLVTIAEFPYKPYHFARISRISTVINDSSIHNTVEEDITHLYKNYPIETWFLNIP